MSGLQIGDTVRTARGKPYLISRFFTALDGTPMARLAPVMRSPGRRTTQASVTSVTLIRTRQLAMAHHYAAEAERPAEEIAPFRRKQMALYAARWLTLAEERNDDPRSALHQGTDRLLDLEVAAP